MVAQWGLSSEEAGVLLGPVMDELDKLPIPVEPEDVAGETERLAAVIDGALRSG